MEQNCQHSIKVDKELQHLDKVEQGLRRRLRQTNLEQYYPEQRLRQRNLDKNILEQNNRRRQSNNLELWHRQNRGLEQKYQHCIAVDERRLR